MNRSGVSGKLESLASSDVCPMFPSYFEPECDLFMKSECPGALATRSRDEPRSVQLALYDSADNGWTAGTAVEVWNVTSGAWTSLEPWFLCC